MTRVAIHTAISLSSTTREAWKAHGAIMLRSDRSLNANIIRARELGADLLLNYGSHSDIREEDREFVWNPPELIRELAHPGAFRRKLGDLVVPRPEEYPADIWIKAPGQAGRGKTRIRTEGALSELPPSWDWQAHIEGTEYRAVTVGNKIVQGFQREGENNARDYIWTGVNRLPERIKHSIRTALQRSNGEGGRDDESEPLFRTVLAWDTILTEGGEAYLFEANSAPGLSEPTAGRIVSLIDRLLND